MPTWLMCCGKTDGRSMAFNGNSATPIAGFLVDTALDRVIFNARDAYTLANLYVRVTVNTLDGNTVVRYYNYNVAGNQTVTIAAAATGVFQDAVNTDAIVAGDRPNTNLNTTASTVGAITYTLIGYTLTTGANNTPILMANNYDGAVWIQFGQQYYGTIAGQFYPTLTEANTQYTLRTASVLSNLYSYVRINSLDAVTTLRTRINGANGNLALSVGAGATGAFEDAVNTDNIAAGQTLSYQQDASASGAGQMLMTSSSVKSTSNARQVAAGDSAGVTLATGLTRYVTIEGSSQAFSAVEADAQMAVQAALYGHNMFVRIPTNTLGGATTFRLRKNAGNGNMNVTVGAAVTGTFEDLASVDSFLAADLINWQVVTGGGGGSIVIDYIGFELTQTSPAGAAVPMMNVVPRMMLAAR